MEAYFFGQRKAVPSAFAEWLAPEVSAAAHLVARHLGLQDRDDLPLDRIGNGIGEFLGLLGAGRAGGGDRPEGEALHPVPVPELVDEGQ